MTIPRLASATLGAFLLVATGCAGETEANLRREYGAALSKRIADAKARYLECKKETPAARCGDVLTRKLSAAAVFTAAEYGYPLPSQDQLTALLRSTSMDIQDSEQK